MEYVWTIQFLLRNGHCVEGIHRGPENSSFEVAKRIFDERPKASFVSCFGKDGDSQLYVRGDDVSSFEIFIKKESKK